MAVQHCKALVVAGIRNGLQKETVQFTVHRLHPQYVDYINTLFAE